MSRQSPVFRLLKQSVERTRDSFILAGVCMVAAYPACHYMAHHMLHRMLPGEVGPGAAKVSMLYQLIMIFGAAMISSMVGFFYSERLGLKGLEGIRLFRRNLLPYLALGMVMIPFSYMLTDRHLFVLIPEYYPSSFVQALGYPLGLALPTEVIFRFGLVTMLVYFWRWLEFTRHPWPASVIVAAFAMVKVFLDFKNMGLIQEFDSFVLRMLASTLLANLIFGEIYIRRGLLAAIFAHLGLQGKYLIYAFLV